MTATNILIVFAGLLISAIGAYFCFFRSPLTATKAEIEDLNRYLKEIKSMADASGNARRFYVEHFEDISKEFYKHDSVKPIWIDFRKSLTRHKTDEVEELYSASDTADYFSFHNFTRGLSMPFWNGYGGVFTGLGILGTFVGLTVGLNNIDMSSADIEVLKGGIASLLSGVQSAFYTSLAGIGIAIIYGPLHNRVVNGFKEEVRNLASMVEEMIQRCTAEEWLHKNYVESAAQTLTLKNIGTDVADAIYDGFDKHFNEGVSRLCDQIEERLAPLFEGLKTSIDMIAVNLGDSVIKAMSERTGVQMEQFAKSLDDFSINVQQSMQDYQSFNVEMKKNILSTLDEMRQTLKEGAEDAAAHQRAVIEENAEQMKSVADFFKATVEKYNDSLTHNCDKITNLLKGTENVLLQVNEATTAIKDAAEPIQQSALTLKNYLEQLDQATKHLHDEISAQLSTLTEANNRSEKNIFLLTAGLQEYEKNIEQAWANYESNFNRVGGELEKSTDLITDRLQKYNEMMNGGMTKALTDFDKSVSGAVGSLQALVEDLQDTIDDLKKERRLD